jgi:hypothetical protein
MQTMDTSAYGQRKGSQGNSRFNCHAGFETQEDTPAPHSPNICSSDFFLFGWFTVKLLQRQLTDADQLFDAVDEIVTSLSIETIEDVFQNWIHRTERVIELNGDYVEERFSDIGNTVPGEAESG